MGTCTPEQRKTLEWLSKPGTGVSSETMALWLQFGVLRDDHCHPLDPADFNRCLRLLDAAPHLREQIRDMGTISSEWWNLVQHWDEIEQCFLLEAGFNWSKSKRAPETYALMKSRMKPQS